MTIRGGAHSHQLQLDDIIRLCQHLTVAELIDVTINLPLEERVLEMNVLRRQLFVFEMVIVSTKILCHPRFVEKIALKKIDFFETAGER